MKLVINYKIPIYNEDNKIKEYKNKYIYEIECNKNISGGDVFDDINIEDIIIQKKEEDIIIKKVKENIKLGEIKKTIIDKHKIKIVGNKENEITKYILSNMMLNEENSIYDLKLLIYYLTDIPIENQNIYYDKKETLFYEYKNNITGENININIKESTIENKSLANIKFYNKIPIDFDLINNRINYTIETYEKIVYLNSLNSKIIEFDFICLDEFIDKIGKTNLHTDINRDTELLNILYKGFIEKFYPYYNMNLFIMYLSNEDKKLEYPALKIKSEEIVKKVNLMRDILKPITKNKKVNFKYITSHYKKLIYQVPSYNETKTLNLKELFNNIELKKYKKIKKLELQLELQNKKIYFTKQSILSNNKLNDTNIFYNNNKGINNLHINNKKYNSLLDTPYIKSNILFLTYELKNLVQLYIVITDTFDIYIIYNIVDYTNEINLLNNKQNDKIYKNQVIEEIGELLNDLYKNNIITEKKIVNKNNITLVLFDVQIILNQNISITNFERIYNELYQKLLLNYYSIVNFDDINNEIELLFNKISSVDITNNKIEILKELSNNFYSFYVKQDLIEKYNKIIYLSKILIKNRIKDISIDVQNIKQNELTDIINIVFNLLYNSNLLTNNASTDITKKNTNKLKKLKEIDPVLYMINKFNTQNLYSRKCQASQQPEIIEKKDVKKYKNYIKYLNFTTGNTAYYTCTNKKYPSVKFLTNLHPQNFCIPCCKKKAVDDIKIKSKYVDVHNECLTSYKYDKKNKNQIVDEKSRYIMNYSSKIVIENLRLMNIPDILIKLFNQMYEQEDEIELKYYILGLNQDVSNIAYVGIFNIMCFALNKTPNDVINIIQQLFIKDPTIFKNILNGRLVHEFKDVKTFITIFLNIFQDKILLSEYNFNFNDWNKLFIEILKYYGFITIIFEEVLHNENEILNLKIPENIRNVNEYIYNNDDYNYIILTKRKHKTLTTEVGNVLYYPIIKTNYKQYYRHNKFYNRTFKYNAPVIKLISQIIESKLIPVNESMTLNFIEEFILVNNNYQIKNYFVNNKNEIYCVLICESNKNDLLLNIKKQKVINAQINVTTQTKTYKLTYEASKKFNISLNTILKFINEFNKYIYSTNKIYYSELYYKSFINSIDKTQYLTNQEYIITDDNYLLPDKTKIRPYVYINNFIVYKDKIIGLQINESNANSNFNYNIYLSNYINVSVGVNIFKSKNKELEHIFKRKKIDKSDIKHIFTRLFLKNIYSAIEMKYDPNIINKTVFETNKTIFETPHSKLLTEAIYHTNLYNLLVLHFTNKLYKLKNTIIRSKLKNLISKLTNSDIKLLLVNKYLGIDDLIVNNVKLLTNENIKLQMKYNVYSFIKNIISSNRDLNLVELKKIINTNLDKTSFIFDKLSIYTILELDKANALKELNNIFKNEVTHTNTNNKNAITLDLCENINKSYNCNNNKLIISKKNYETFLEIWYYDLTNPFKQKLILNLVNYNLNNIYQFKQFDNERIFIYL